MSNQFAKTANNKKRKQNAKGKSLTKKQKMEVVKLIEAPKELKFYDSVYNQNVCTITPVFYDLSDPGQGTGPSNTIGTEIELKSLSYHFYFTKDDETNYIRFLIFQWYPNTEHDSPQWNQMFQYFTAGVPSNQYELMSPYQLGEGGTKNFRVLIDEQFYLDGDNPIQMIKGYINKGFRKSIEIETSASHFGTNHIYLMTVSDSNLSGPTLSGYTRIRYTDS